MVKRPNSIEYKLPKLETKEYSKADLNRPKEGSVEPPNGQTAKLNRIQIA
jgi:hypothetical protein